MNKKALAAAKAGRYRSLPAVKGKAQTQVRLLDRQAFRYGGELIPVRATATEKIALSATRKSKGIRIPIMRSEIDIQEDMKVAEALQRSAPIVVPGSEVRIKAKDFGLQPFQIGERAVRVRLAGIGYTVNAKPVKKAQTVNGHMHKHEPASSLTPEQMTDQYALDVLAGKAPPPRIQRKIVDRSDWFSVPDSFYEPLSDDLLEAFGEK